MKRIREGFSTRPKREANGRAEFFRAMFLNDAYHLIKTSFAGIQGLIGP